MSRIAENLKMSWTNSKICSAPTNAALIVVDMQNDFICGSLKVPGAEDIIPIINQVLKLRFGFALFTMDWHPEGHISFQTWPEHCVAGTAGADLHSDLVIPRNHNIILKGYDPNIDSYSAFYANDHARPTELPAYVKKHNIKLAYICGLATDYCVKFTALDAINEGLETYVIVDACRGVKMEDTINALNELKQAGVTLLEHIV